MGTIGKHDATSVDAVLSKLWTQTTPVSFDQHPDLFGCDFDTDPFTLGRFNDQTHTTLRRGKPDDLETCSLGHVGFLRLQGVSVFPPNYSWNDWIYYKRFGFESRPECQLSTSDLMIQKERCIRESCLPQTEARHSPLESPAEAHLILFSPPSNVTDSKTIARLVAESRFWGTIR